MMHKNRRFSVVERASAEDLAHELTRCTWTLCTGFKLGDLLFLNDSISEDGAAEYGVVHKGVQIESITFGWATLEQSLSMIQECQRDVANGTNMKLSAVNNPIEDSHGHSCSLCR